MFSRFMRLSRERIRSLPSVVKGVGTVAGVGASQAFLPVRLFADEVAYLDIVGVRSPHAGPLGVRPKVCPQGLDDMLTEEEMNMTEALVDIFYGATVESKQEAIDQWNKNHPDKALTPKLLGALLKNVDIAGMGKMGMNMSDYAYFMACNTIGRGISRGMDSPTSEFVFYHMAMVKMEGAESK